MNSIWQAYYNMFNTKKNNINTIKHLQKNIIKEDDDDDDIDDDDDSDDSDNTDDDTDDSDNTDDNDENADDQNSDESPEDIEAKNNNEAELKFSADLAAEFGNTCNKFTVLATKAVKKRTVDKKTSEQLKAILEKLNSLIDAAKQTI